MGEAGSTISLLALDYYATSGYDSCMDCCRLAAGPTVTAAYLLGIQPGGLQLESIVPRCSTCAVCSGFGADFHQ